MSTNALHQHDSMHPATGPRRGGDGMNLPYPPTPGTAPGSLRVSSESSTRGFTLTSTPGPAGRAEAVDTVAYPASVSLPAGPYVFPRPRKLRCASRGPASAGRRGFYSWSCRPAFYEALGLTIICIALFLGFAGWAAVRGLA